MRTRVAKVLGAVVVVALVAGNVVFALLWQHARGENGTRVEVTSVARSFLSALTNFKATTIDQDVRRIRSYAVGDFADQVDQFFGPQAVAAIRQAEAKSVGRVQSVFVQTLSGGTASAFGLVSETVTNKSSASARAELLRVVVQLIETKGGWKVNQVNILQSPGTSPFGSG